jgi:hypothetical protein
VRNRRGELLLALLHSCALVLLLLLLCAAAASAESQQLHQPLKIVHHTIRGGQEVRPRLVRVAPYIYTTQASLHSTQDCILSVTASGLCYISLCYMSLSTIHRMRRRMQLVQLETSEGLKPTQR